MFYPPAGTFLIILGRTAHGECVRRIRGVVVGRYGAPHLLGHFEICGESVPGCPKIVLEAVAQFHRQSSHSNYSEMGPEYVVPYALLFSSISS